MNGGAGRTITLLGRVGVAPTAQFPDAAVWRGRRAELVFAYLAAEHGRQVTNDELADALWPDGLPETWEAGLRGVLTEVRRYLTESGLAPAVVLATARRGHQLQLPTTVAVDLDEAREALAAAHAAVGEGNPGTAAHLAARVWSLTRLPFLPNHDGAWVEGIRRDLERMGGRALDLETRSHAAAGDLPSAAAAAERLVAAEPFNEAAHQLRLRILGQAGDRSGVIKAYEHCRAVLAEELGVEPSDETAAVFRAATTTAPPTEASPPAAVDGLAALSVLVVEDHDFQRRTAVMLVRKLGVGSVSEAADGVAALELLGGGLYPDVIVCDIDMPGMDGVAFIRHVAEGELAGAVVIASGLDAKLIRAVRSVAEGYGLQVLGAVEKPLSARRLGELLAAYRSRPRIHPADPLGMSAVEVAAALRDGRICIHLLPGVDASTAQVTTADAVPRWHDQARGWVPLGSIPALTERESLLAELSERALDVACDYLSGFARSGPDIGVCIDLAPASLRDTSLADRAADVARARGADPTRVTLAVDERALRTSPSTALDVLTRLRVKGFGVSLDNFGAGHASTEQLRRVPFTEVRLAPHLVTGAGGDGPRVRALEDAVAVGRELAGVIVGRGCESEDDLRLLLELGCDRVQGEFIAAAMPGEDLPGWVAAWDPLRLGSGGRE